MWDSVAPNWEAHAGAVDEQLAEATEALLDAAGIAAGDNVLDLATGPGGAGLAALVRVGPNGSVVLSDSAPEMVAVAARRASGTEQVSTGVFDQSVAAVAEAVRVLRPGGRYATMTWDRRDHNPWPGLRSTPSASNSGCRFLRPAFAARSRSRTPTCWPRCCETEVSRT